MGISKLTSTGLGQEVINKEVCNNCESVRKVREEEKWQSSLLASAEDVGKTHISTPATLPGCSHDLLIT